MAPKHENISPETAATVTGLSDEQFQKLLTAAQGNSSNDAIALLATTMRELVAAQNRSADATERTTIRSNATHPGVNAFSMPGGDRDSVKNNGRAKPSLNAKTLFCGVPQFEDTLTPVEIDLFNAITSGRSARDGAWTATFLPSTNAGKPTLHVTIAIVEGDLASTPPLVQILAELATGAKAQDVTTLLVDMARMKNELDALKAQVHPEAVGA